MSVPAARVDPSGQRIRGITTAGVAGLAAGAFLLSYDALHQLARTSHVPAPLAWLWPLIVDGFILVASLAVLDAVHAGRRARYPWLLVLAFSTLSVAFNVLHAPHHPVAQLVAAIPPLALVLSFELLMRQIRPQPARKPVARDERPRQSTSPEPKAGLATSVDTAPMPPLPPPQTEPVQPPTVTRPATTKATRQPRAVTQARADAVRAECARTGRALTTAVLAQRLGVSDGYARRLLRDLNAADDDAHAGEQAVPSLRAVGP